MQEFLAAHADWLTVVRLPAYAPELNVTEVSVTIIADWLEGESGLAEESIE